MKYVLHWWDCDEDIVAVFDTREQAEHHQYIEKLKGLTRISYRWVGDRRLAA